MTWPPQRVGEGMTRELVEKIKKLAELAERQHYECEDSYYACPKAEGGCCNDEWGKDECSCGADTHNEKVRQLVASMRGEGSMIKELADISAERTSMEKMPKIVPFEPWWKNAR